MSLTNVYFGAIQTGGTGPADGNWNTSIQFKCQSIVTPPAIGDVYSNNGVNFTISAESNLGYDFTFLNVTPFTAYSGAVYSNNGHSYTLSNTAFTYVFTVSGVTTVPTVGAGYYISGLGSYIVTATSIVAGSGTITMTQAYAFVTAPTATGSLLLYSGTGQASISYSACLMSGTLDATGTGAPSSTGSLTKTSGTGPSSIAFTGTGLFYSINAGGSGTSLASGTLARVSGSGDSSIAFTTKSDVNWYSNPGSGAGGCCCGTAGTPLYRLPNVSTDNVIISNGNVITGPTGGWSGPVTIALQNSGDSPGTSASITTGVYSGLVTLVAGTSSSPSTIGWISGGTFSGGVVISANSTAYSQPYVLYPVLSGGSYTGNITVNADGVIIKGITHNSGTISTSGTNAPEYSYTRPNLCLIQTGCTFGASTRFSGYFQVSSGSTWSPSYSTTVNVKTGVMVTTSLPVDPGFAANATFSPTYTITNIPDILGTGLL